jgi:hypothetical protein
LNDVLASIIRTYVPIIVGQVISWLTVVNINLDAQSTAALSTVLGGLISAVYYALVRLLEQKWPSVGVLLGLPKSPDSYSKGKPVSVDASVQYFPADVPVPTIEVLPAETQSDVPAPHFP